MWLWCAVWKTEEKIPSGEGQLEDGIERAISWVQLTVKSEALKGKVKQEFNQFDFRIKQNEGACYIF